MWRVTRHISFASEMPSLSEAALFGPVEKGQTAIFRAVLQDLCSSGAVSIHTYTHTPRAMPSGAIWRSVSRPRTLRPADTHRRPYNQQMTALPLRQHTLTHTLSDLKAVDMFSSLSWQ